jgi:microcystin-dependent protein
MSRRHDSEPAPARRTFLRHALAWVGGAVVLAGARRVQAAPQATDPYISEIIPWAANFAPRGWAECNGQLLPINQNQALFSLLGTTYGGNGVTTFALPDLRGRVPIGVGQGPGLADYPLGTRAGAETHTLSVAEMPAHAHVARGSSALGTAASPSGLVPARSAAQVPQYGSTADATLAASALFSAGGGQAHPNMQPYTTVMFIIALQGVFPFPAP